MLIGFVCFLTGMQHRLHPQLCGAAVSRPVSDSDKRIYFNAVCFLQLAHFQEYVNTYSYQRGII